MTKKHFLRLAAALVAFQRRLDGASLTSDQFEALVDQIALACSDCSDNFDYARFRDACGLEG